MSYHHVNRYSLQCGYYGATYGTFIHGLMDAESRNLLFAVGGAGESIKHQSGSRLLRQTGKELHRNPYKIFAMTLILLSKVHIKFFPLLGIQFTCGYSARTQTSRVHCPFVRPTGATGCVDHCVELARGSGDTAPRRVPIMTFHQPSAPPQNNNSKGNKE